ncbi:YgiW/YdeI family stress tolerance OB fold protein [uncultured Vibrio sp.]|uniref:YgiW/YdeI family stress tolerance OB fold protein n=1 Tax=uncultured Vibrio sp. TaxID=114054 RepID=UPI0026027645|nr:NirD/YgiW/YdeI family stress tolerance protein [uncultured Vibrio sp.]
MKKTILTSVLILTSGFVMANPQNLVGGGFNGPTAQMKSTVAQALEASDESMVQIKGYITQFLGDDKYTFTDGTHNIVIDIDSDKWMGVTVTPKDKVIIVGEVDKDWSEVTIDVDRIQLAM